MLLRLLFLSLGLSLSRSAFGAEPPALRFREMLPAPGSALAGVTFGNGLFVVVGKNGTVLSSPDVKAWQSQSVGTNFNFAAVTYGGGLFAATGIGPSNGVMATSSDAVHWTVRDIKPAQQFNAMTYGNGVFVALGAEGAVAISSDGIGWEQLTLTNSLNFICAAFGNGIFAAATGAGVYSSTDGRDWSLRDSRGVGAIAFGNGLFVATVTSGGSVLTSTNGTTWSDTGNTNTWITGLAFGASKFVGVGVQAAWTSSDCRTWTVQTLPVPLDAGLGEWSATYGNGQFLAVPTGYDAPRILLSSPDGLEWQPIGSSILQDLDQGFAGHGLTYGDGQFVLPLGRVGMGGGPGSPSSWAMAVSPDGISWRTQTIGGMEPVLQVAFGQDRFVGVGLNSVVLSDSFGQWLGLALNEKGKESIASAGGRFFLLTAGGQMLTSDDGLAWTRQSTVTSNTLSSVAYGNGLYIAVGDAGTMLSSTDATNWQPRNSGTSNPLSGVVYGNDLFVAVGTGMMLVSRDGLSWNEVGAINPNDRLYDVAFGNDTFVAVGTAGVLVSGDGINWKSEITSAPNGYGCRSVAYGGGKFLIIGAPMLQADVTQPVLDQAGLDAKGRLTFRLSGEKGQVYRIQGTEDLTAPNWTDAGVVTNSTATVQFLVPPLHGAARQFYRATAAQ
jgi:hypothetical protein